LKLLLFFVAFVMVRRVISRFLSPGTTPPPPRRERSEPPRQEPTSGGHPAIGDDEVIEDGEFEELD